MKLPKGFEAQQRAIEAPHAPKAPSPLAIPAPQATVAAVPPLDSPTPTPAPQAKQRKPKVQAAKKPEGLKEIAAINIRCSLVRYDGMMTKAKSLGLTLTAYMLFCEEAAANKLVGQLIRYLETLATMRNEPLEKRLQGIEALLETLTQQTNLTPK